MFPDVQGKLREEIPNCAGGHSSFTLSRFILAWGMWVGPWYLDHWILTTDKRRINEMTVRCTTDLRGSPCLHLYKEPKGQVVWIRIIWRISDKKRPVWCARGNPGWSSSDIMSLWPPCEARSRLGRNQVVLCHALSCRSAIDSQLIMDKWKRTINVPPTRSIRLGWVQQT